VIMCSELVNYVGESVVANTRYGILVHQDSAFMIDFLTGI
jgi:hypothetical protein